MGITVPALIALATLMAGCSMTDGDYIPFGLTGFGVYVTDPSTNKTVYAGHVDANYFSREEGLRSCAATAHAWARGKPFGYVCCTITASSDCVTKVR